MCGILGFLCFIPWVAIPHFVNKGLQRDVRLSESPRNGALLFIVFAWACLAFVFSNAFYPPRRPSTPDVDFSGLYFVGFIIAFVLPLLPTILVMAWVLTKNEIRARASYRQENDRQG
jgi:hypothetical protein